jgi:hypothetical protein
MCINKPVYAPLPYLRCKYRASFFAKVNGIILGIAGFWLKRFLLFSSINVKSFFETKGFVQNFLTGSTNKKGAVLSSCNIYRKTIKISDRVFPLNQQAF